MPEQPRKLPDGYAILVERDEDFDPVGSIATGDEAADRAYVAQVRAGIITAYVVSVVRVDSRGDVACVRAPSGAFFPDALTSLGGCDVETSNADGLYLTLDAVPDDHLREIAADLVTDIPTGPCQYDDGTEHSDDLLFVWHGTAIPAELCGKHTADPIDWTKVHTPVPTLPLPGF